MPKIVVLGAGEYGTALGGILAGNGFDVDYYDPLKEKEVLKDAVTGAKAMVLVVPSETAVRLLPHLPKDKFLIVATKGSLSERPFTVFKNWGVLSGAGFAKDFKSGKNISLTATDDKISTLFAAPQLSFDYSDDKKGVLLCGALKNVYALLAGIRGLKPNTKKMSDYIFNAANEMGMILEQNGANLTTMRLSCGLKDLILTCSPGSRNYTYGLNTFKNINTGLSGTVESLTTLKRIKRGELVVPDSALLLQELLEEF